MHLQPIPNTPQGGHHGAAHQPKRREKLTGATVFLAMLLTVFLIALGERATYDINRLFNPLYGQCRPSQYLIISDVHCTVEDFAMKTVLSHSYVTLPLFLLFLSTMLYLKRHRPKTWQEAIYRVTGMAALVFGLQVLLEVTFYLFQYHRLIAWYFTFGVGIIGALWLVIFLERRQDAKRQAKHGGGGHGSDDDEDH